MDSNKKYILIILFLGIFTRFIFFSYPAETVFDEVHFGKFISGYFTGQYFFDIHPPLGKLMIAGVAKLASFKPGFNFETISEKFPDQTYKWLRFLPKFFGAILPLIVFLLALEFGISRKYSFLAGLLMVFETANIVQSRLILLDSFLLAFGFLSLLFYLKALKSSKWQYFLLAGIFGVFAVSIKWTGLAFLGLMILSYFMDNNQGVSKKLSKILLYFVITPFIIYFSIFLIHFYLLPKSGPGDAFQSIAFQKTLVDSKYQGDTKVQPANLVEKFYDLNKAMFGGNAGLTASHPYGSKWYQWPFMTRPIYYWNGADNKDARIYFIGNPVVWWAGTIAVLFVLIQFLNAIYNLLRGGMVKLNNFDSPFQLLFIGYILNMLPFFSIKRVMFLYHYLPALIFSILILVYLLDKHGDVKIGKVPLYSLLLGLAIAMFIIFSPLVYGGPISPKIYNSLVWFPSWK